MNAAERDQQCTFLRSVVVSAAMIIVMAMWPFQLTGHQEDSEGFGSQPGYPKSRERADPAPGHETK